MKKLLFGFIAAAAALGMTGCLKSDNDTYEKIKRIQPGADIYRAGSSQNDLGIDAGSVGIRFAILLSEAAYQATTDLTKVICSDNNGGSINLYTRYFSSGAALEQDINHPERHRLSFNDNYGSFDRVSRRGTYQIDTKGLLLEQTNHENRWEISVFSEQMVLSNSTVGQVTVYPVAVTTLHFDGSAFVMECKSFQCRSTTPGAVAEFTSDWDVAFRLKPSGNTNLTYTSVRDNIYNFSGTAEGQTCFSFNQLSGVNLNYSVSANTPLLFKPEITAVYPVSGTERCTLTRPADYDESYFVSPTVDYSWIFNNGILSYAITYNGATEQF